MSVQEKHIFTSTHALSDEPKTVPQTDINVPRAETTRLSDALDAQAEARKVGGGRSVLVRLVQLEQDKVLAAKEVARFMARVERLEAELGIEVPPELA